MASITSNMRGGVVADMTPPGSKAGASTDEWGRTVLTLVAPGRSEGVGEEEQCVLAGVERDDSAVQRKQRKAARGDDPVRLLLSGQLWLGVDDALPWTDSPASCSSSHPP
jgi:hypothetical protein